MRRAFLMFAILPLTACASSHAIEPQLASASVSFSGAAVERVELANFDFTPREIHLHAGQPYELVLTNLATGAHDFAAPEFFAAARIKPEDAPLVAEGEVELAAMATRAIHLVPAAGEYKLACTHTGHALLGMTGKIVVE